jgi:uncharacterized protein YutE (UPF0331/DUF86 family)
MVRHDLIAQKLATARARLKASEEIFGKPIEDFLSDEKERDLATFYLFLAIQECIDIAAHWVADADWGPPEEAGAAFEILRDKKVIDAELAQGLRAATGLRNRIAHGYTAVDPRRLHGEYRKGAEVLHRFLAIAAEAVGL